MSDAHQQGLVQQASWALVVVSAEHLMCQLCWHWLTSRAECGVVQPACRCVRAIRCWHLLVRCASIQHSLQLAHKSWAHASQEILYRENISNGLPLGSQPAGSCWLWWWCGEAHHKHSRAQYHWILLGHVYLLLATMAAWDIGAVSCNPACLNEVRGQPNGLLHSCSCLV